LANGECGYSILEMELKVVSWNIWLAGDLKGIAEFVKNSGADIIGMQEVIPEREPNIMQTIEALGYHSAFSTALEVRHDGKKMGNAIFSKYPIKSQQTHILSETKSGPTTAENERRVAVEADIDVGGILLSVFSTHIAHAHKKPSERQLLQIESLLEVVPRGKAIVLGDFNATPQTEPIQRMEEVLTNTDPSGAPTWSLYPAGCTVCDPQAVDTRFDYIFTTHDLKIHSPKVESSPASDHLPVSVIVELS